MRVPTFSRNTMLAFVLAAASAFAQLPASAATAIMHAEQRQISDSGNDVLDCDRAMQQRSTAIQEQIPCENPAQNKAWYDAKQRRREAALRDERLSEQRVRDEQLHEQQLHEQRLHDARVHEERLHDERIHEQRLRDARSHR